MFFRDENTSVKTRKIIPIHRKKRNKNCLQP